MVQFSSSPAGQRFLASIREGRGLKQSTRDAGVHQEVGYRWLKERYLQLRRGGAGPAEAVVHMGFRSSKMEAWELEVDRSTRHHLRVQEPVEDVFWGAFKSGASSTAAATAAGVSRSTAHRWLSRRYAQLRRSGASLRTCQRQLRLTERLGLSFEQTYQQHRRASTQAATRAQREAIATSRRYGEHLTGAVLSSAQQARAERNQRYWQLMRSGTTNTEACRLLGMSRRTGGVIRRAANQQVPSLHPPHWSGRYLDARERVQIADLLQLGFSIRAIARVLARAPSTIKRELDRHRDAAGRYLPAVAEHDAKAQRTRPKVAKLVAQDRLRVLVQRKLNRCWSPAQISGWLAKAYPDDPAMRVCPETIYRELLLRADGGLHRRYAAKLRTGRQIRKSRWLTTTGQGTPIKNPVMIDQRPPEVQARQQVGHWEGDLIIGRDCASAMVTLRERVTHYGIIINLPVDHTAASVNAAIIEAFSHLPGHLKRTLTWDQGVEMSRHQDLAAATGVRIYFAEKSSPWQRGANENFNGLVRQYFPKRTNLAVHTPQRVAQVMAELNHRPRKSLGYDTPTQRFKRHLHDTRPVSECAPD